MWIKSKQQIIAAKIVISASAFALVCTPLRCLDELGNSIKYHSLGEFYSSGRGCSLPRMSEFYLNFAPVSEWSYLSALFIAVGIGRRISGRYKAHNLLGLLFGSCAIYGATVSAIVPFSLATNYLGFPVERLYSRTELLTNIGMLSAALIFAIMPALLRRKRTRELESKP